jgi:glycopeptide antibiotics resistance protein
VINEKLMESYNPHREIVHQYVFINVVFLLEDQELIINTLGYLLIYFIQRFMYVCCRGQQDQVDKDSNFSFIFLVISVINDHRGVSLPLCIYIILY